MSARADAAAATRGRLLAAAWRHFATRPYENVRLREIALEANVTVPTLHAHFHSKDQLFTAAFLRWGQQEMTQRDEAPVGDTRAAIRVLFDSYETHGTAILRMISQEEQLPAIRQMTDAGRAYHRAWAERTFRPLLRGMRGDSQEQRLRAIIAATDLLVWKVLRQDMQLDRRDAERTMAEMVPARSTRSHSPSRS
jgi:AcrR family transcriptional regulator